MYEYKNKIILIIIFIAIYISGYYIGRNWRLTNISTVGSGTESTTIELTERANKLESELNDRIRQCEQLEVDSERIKSGINECRGLVQQLGRDLDTAGLENQNAIAYVKELRKRFDAITIRVQQLEAKLETIEGSSD